MFPGDGETNAWVWTTDFIRDQPLVAYVRLKVSDNTSSGEVARFSATGGGTLSLKGSDFSAPNSYQEFPLPFQFTRGEDFLIFNVWRSGPAEVTFDAITIFTAPATLASPYTWIVPGGNYRGQGVWVRYTDGGEHFSDFSEGSPLPAGIKASPAALSLLAARSGPFLTTRTISVQAPCGNLQWTVQEDAGWMEAQRIGNTVVVTIDHSRLAVGSYLGTLSFRGVGSGKELAAVTVTLAVVERVFPVLMPLLAFQ